MEISSSQVFNDSAHSFLSIFSFAGHILKLALSFTQRAASRYFLSSNRKLETDWLEVMQNATSREPAKY